jgi:hypothetical protein
MKNLFTILLFSFSLNALVEDDTSREENYYKYNYLGIDAISTENTEVGVRMSLSLPGPLYLTLERKTEGVNKEINDYERIINGIRLGVHAGIGDIFSSMSASGISLEIKNIFDLYTEFGIKNVEFDDKDYSFSEDEAQANLIAGIRFGNSNGWEGKFFVDYSKDFNVVQTECPPEAVCPTVVEFELEEKSDQRLGAGVLYNINKYSAVTLEISSSKILDNNIKLGYQINF